MTEIVLDGISVGDGRPAYCIAEIGHNHLGDIEECKKLMFMAADAGAQACKLQKRDNLELYTKGFFDSAYNSEASYAATYGKHRDYLEFGLSEYLELQEYANYLGITFIATPFDLFSLEFLEALNVPYYKIASGSITNPLLLRKVASIGKPVVASFGGATADEVERAIILFDNAGTELVMLHCTAAYPAAPEELGLGRITDFAQKYPEHVIGFSDHDDGIAMAVSAYTLGARVFEKHITLSHTNRGTDHAFSLESAGLRAYINNLREAYAASQTLDHPLNSEKGPLYKMGGACYFNKNMKAGWKILEDDIVIKSPAAGLDGWEYDNLVGLELNQDVLKEMPLTWEMFE